MKVAMKKYKKIYSTYDFCYFLSEKTKIDIDIFLKVFSPITFVLNSINIFREKISPRVKVKIDDHDIWGMNTDLAEIIYPMLVKFRASTISYPLIDIEDVPKHLRSSNLDSERWDYVVDRMLYSFNHILTEFENIPEIPYCFPHTDLIYKDFGVVCYDIPQFETLALKTSFEDGIEDYFQKRNDNKKYFYCDWSELHRHNDYVQEGFALFGKYYQNLWV